MPAPSLDGVAVSNLELDATSSFNVTRTSAGTNRYGLAAICGQIFNGASTTAMTWNGVAMTQLAQIFRGWECVDLWGIVNPATGSSTVAATTSNNAYGRFIVCCIQDAGTVGTAVTTTGTSSAPTSGAVSSATGDLVLGWLGATSADPAEGGTLIAEGSRGGSIWGSAQYYPGAASVAPAWSGSQTSWATVGLNIAAIADPVSPLSVSGTFNALRPRIFAPGLAR